MWNQPEVTKNGRGRLKRQIHWNLSRAASAWVFALCIGCASADSATSYTRQGYVLSHRGEYNAAISTFDDALKADPDDAEAYYGRGAAHRSAGQYDAAIADYTSAIQLEPRWFDYEGRGVIYELTGNWAPALADYSEAIKLKPQSASLYVRRASLYARGGDLQMAKADLDKAAGIAGASPSLNYLLYYSWILATSPSPQMRNGNEAVRYAAEAYDMTYNCTGMLDTLAAAYAENGQFDKAIEYQKKCCELMREEPGHPVMCLRHLEERLALYEKHQPYRESQASLAH